MFQLIQIFNFNFPTVNLTVMENKYEIISIFKSACVYLVLRNAVEHFLRIQRSTEIYSIRYGRHWMLGLNKMSFPAISMYKFYQSPHGHRQHKLVPFSLKLIESRCPLLTPHPTGPFLLPDHPYDR